MFIATEKLSNTDLEPTAVIDVNNACVRTRDQSHSPR
jgi:hypothetical protein